MSDRFTEDRLLGGRVLLRQPLDGLRAAIDPVLLSASVPAEAGQRVLDLGTGTGVAALCLARRVACRAAGLELQDDLVGLARENAALNGFGAEIEIIAGDVARPPFEPGSFDHVMANPPFVENGAGTRPPSRSKAVAVGEGATALSVWVDAALTLVRAKGSVTIIHRADRLDALLAAFSGRAGAIVVFPLWSGQGKQAKRVLVRARRGLATPLRLAAGLVLHEADGRYTAPAEAVLRDGMALEL